MVGALLIAAACGAQSYVINTVAGASFVGDGGPATLAELGRPAGVAVDSAGNLYISERGPNRIRKVDTSGTITTFAGGMLGSSGDGGPATAAGFNSPGGVAVDGAGNVYIADSGNRRIRKVDTTGTITTFAGGGPGPSDGDGGPATAALLSLPSDVAVDSARNVFIADTFGDRIRKVDTSGTITTIAGPANAAQLDLPTGVAVDGVGNVYIADSRNHRIGKVDTSGTITTIAGDGLMGFGGDGGPATAARFNNPGGVAVDSAGNIYIADSRNDRIRRVDSAGTITTIAGDGTAGFQRRQRAGDRRAPQCSRRCRARQPRERLHCRCD